MNYKRLQDLLNCLFPIFLSSYLTVFWSLHKAAAEETTWITYLGCYSGQPTAVDSYQTYVITMNHPGACSRLCAKWEYFALQNTECNCFNKRCFKELHYLTYNRCHLKCPDFTNKMYCGWHDMRSVYRRETDFNFNETSNCLAIIRRHQRNEIKPVPCQEKLQSICENPRGIFLMEEKYPFQTAKLHCENMNGKLIINDKNLPHGLKENTTSWMGTFRQYTKTLTVASPTALQTTVNGAITERGSISNQERIYTTQVKVEITIITETLTTVQSEVEKSFALFALSIKLYIILPIAAILIVIIAILSFVVYKNGKQRRRRTTVNSENDQRVEEIYLESEYAAIDYSTVEQRTGIRQLVPSRREDSYENLKDDRSPSSHTYETRTLYESHTHKKCISNSHEFSVSRTTENEYMEVIA